ncbi:hypothetical protein ACRAWG_36555 [Methylobacterium sp. P31]
MRNLILVGATCSALLGVAAPASAEDTTVVHRNSGPAVAVEHREGVVEHRSVTTSTDCGSKTVHKEDGAGNSKTVHKEGC